MQWEKSLMHAMLCVTNFSLVSSGFCYKFQLSPFKIPCAAFDNSSFNVLQWIQLDILCVETESTQQTDF